MLLPQFSLRTTLLWLTAGAVFALTGFGRSGGAWGVALTAALVSVCLTLCVHAFFYLAIASFARLLGAEEVIARTSQGALVPTIAAAPRSAGVSSLADASPAPRAASPTASSATEARDAQEAGDET